MSTDMKLMGKQDATSGALTDIKYYTFTEYDGAADLVEISEWPEGFGPWTYDTETKTAVAATAAISLSQSSIIVAPDNVQTVDVTISGESGKVVKASFEGAVPISNVQWTLDGNGEAVVTFGPTTMRTTWPMKVVFDLDDGSSPATATLEVNLQ